MLFQSQFVGIILQFIELWFYNAKHYWTTGDYIIKSGSFWIQFTCSVYIIQKMFADLVVFKAYIFVAKLNIDQESVHIIPLSIPDYIFITKLHFYTSLHFYYQITFWYHNTFYYQITFWYQITFYYQITFHYQITFLMKCIITGCGFNVSNTNPTICINDIIKLYNKEHSTSLPMLTKEKLLARTVNLIEEFIKDFQLNGRTGFCKKYYQRWLHG